MHRNTLSHDVNQWLRAADKNAVDTVGRCVTLGDEMANAPEEKLPTHLSLRHPTQELLDKIEAVRASSDYDLTRSDVIRAALLRGLAEMEADATRSRRRTKKIA